MSRTAQDYPDREGTVLETDDDIRTALMAVRKAQDATSVRPTLTPPPQPVGRVASPFRPTARPPVPILTVFDDGRLDGEHIRIRQPRFVIGRTEGDLQFPLDGRMSARHVEITHQVVGGTHRWVITDLQSTHGMFVRVSKTPLADKSEILVGGGRYRFEAAQLADDRTIDQPGSAGPDTARTQGLDQATAQYRPAALTELIGREIGNRIVLVKDEYWIGGDPACALARPDDPFCEWRHARIGRNRKGQWVAEHHKTPNGLWLRMSQIPADSQVMFQIGEQRFRLRID